MRAYKQTPTHKVSAHPLIQKPAGIVQTILLAAANTHSALNKRYATVGIPFSPEIYKFDKYMYTIIERMAIQSKVHTKFARTH